jgi:hypothetical protein
MPPVGAGDGEQTVAPDREDYGARQAELLAALRDPEKRPRGFEADDLTAASGSLVRKRARQVAASWPALAHELGEDYLTAFARFVRTTPPPVVGEGLADGLAFASSLRELELTDHVRAEILLARGALKRGLYLGVARLHDPHRILVVVRVPRLGRGHASFPIPGRRP